MALSTAGLVLPHKEYLAQLGCAVFAPEAGLVVQLPKSKESILSEGFGAGGTLLLIVGFCQHGIGEYDSKCTYFFPG